MRQLVTSLASCQADEWRGQVRTCQCPVSYFMCEDGMCMDGQAMPPAKYPGLRWAGKRKNKPKNLTFPESHTVSMGIAHINLTVALKPPQISDPVRSRGWGIVSRDTRPAECAAQGFVGAVHLS